MTTLRFDKIIEMKRLVVAKRAGGCRCGSKIRAGWSPWVENVLSLGCIRVNLLAGMFCSFCKMLPLMKLDKGCVRPLSVILIIAWPSAVN